MTSPTSSQPADWARIGRYLAGECTPAEAADVERWLAAHPEEARAARLLDSAARAVKPERVDVERALRGVKARAAASGQRSPERLRTFMSRIEFMAAAAAIILVAGVFVFRRVETVRGPAPEVAYHTGVGQRDSVTLSDGSVVHLGPASRIVVRDRDVTLTGTGYFRVAHDVSRPFVVHANGIQVRDIGTEFGVNADSGRPVRVVVREGVVSLHNASDSVVLNQGDIGVAPRSGRVQASRGTASADDVAWMQGRLVFRDATLEEVAADLRRWYGVEIRVTDDALLRRVFTGSFTTETPDRVLEAIGLALGVRVERRGDVAFLSPAAIK